MAVTQVPSRQIGNNLTDQDFASANVDGPVGTPSLRTIGTGGQQAAAGNHTHLASAITDFAAKVLGYTLGLRVVYLSTLVAGATEADPVANTGTDVTSAVQAKLNNGKILLVVDGLWLVDYLDLWPLTVLLGAYPGCGFLKKGLGTGRPLLRNKNPTAGPTAPADYSIGIRNLTLHGNRVNYGSGNDGSNATFASAYARAVANTSGFLVSTVGMFGVQDFYCEDVIVKDSPSYGMWFANVRDVHIRNYSKYTRSTADQPGNDGLHINGYSYRVHGIDITVTCNDDALALCANDGNDSAVTGTDITFETGTVAVGGGPITDSTFRGLRCLDGAGGGVMEVLRCVTAHVNNPIRNVLVEDVNAVLGFNNGSVNGYAGANFDTFGVVGDNSKGSIDGVVLKNWVLDGFGTGAGNGFAPVHIDRSNVKRLEVENFRYKGYALNQAGTVVPSPVTTTPNAVVDTLVIRKFVNESRDPLSALLTLGGTHKTVIVDDCEFDMRVAGATYPKPLFQDIPLVQVNGPVDELIIQGGRASGLSHVVRVTGNAPKNLFVNGVSLRASKGGAAIRSDVFLPKVTAKGLDADHYAYLPAGAMLDRDSPGKYADRYMREAFAGAAGALLAGYTNPDGQTWQAAVGANTIKQDGTGAVYAGGASSFTAAPVVCQPPSRTFEYENDFIRDAVIPAGESLEVSLFVTGAGDLTDYWGLRITATTAAFVHNSTVVAVTTSLPAVGGVRRFRLAPYNVPGTNDFRMSVDYSDDGGRTWATWMPTCYFTTALPVVVGIRTITAAGWAAAGGYRLGGRPTIRTFGQPIPGPYVAPPFTPSSIATTGLHFDRTFGEYVTVAGAAANNTDPVGDWIGRVGEAQQPTAGLRLIMNADGLSGDGASKIMSIVNGPYVVPASQPFDITVIGSRTLTSQHVVFLAGRAGVPGNGAFVGAYAGGTFYLLLDGPVVLSIAYAPTGKFEARLIRDASNVITITATGLAQTVLGTSSAPITFYDVGARGSAEYTDANARLCQIVVMLEDPIAAGDDANMQTWATNLEGVSIP